MKAFTLIEILVVIAIIGLLVLLTGSLIRNTTITPENESAWCLQKGDYSQQSLPAKCLKYFK